MDRTKMREVDALMGLLGGGGGEPCDESTPDELRRLHAKFAEQHDFRVGQLVTAVEGLDTVKWPKPGTPAVIVEILDEPVVKRDHDAANHQADREDIVIGVILKGSLETFLADSRRFEPYQE